MTTKKKEPCFRPGKNQTMLSFIQIYLSTLPLPSASHSFLNDVPRLSSSKEAYSLSSGTFN